MEKISLNGKLQLLLPDGFRVMDEEEKARLDLISEGELAAFSGPERHITGTAGWRDIGAVTALLVSAGDAASVSERQVTTAMSGYGYTCSGYCDRKIAGKKAKGFDYSYVASDTAMSGETIVMKDGRTLTTSTCITVRN